MVKARQASAVEGWGGRMVGKTGGLLSELRVKFCHCNFSTFCPAVLMPSDLGFTEIILLKLKYIA